MREEEFRKYLGNIESINSKDKAVNSRISRANIAEDILNESLDYVVSDDDRMYEALKTISKDLKERNGCIQNAVRWYYKFINNKEFPKLVTYNRNKNRTI